MEIDPLAVDGDFTISAFSKSEYVEHSTTRTHETSLESKNPRDPFQFKIGTLLYHKISDKEFTQEHLTQAYTYNVLKGLNAPARETHHSKIEDKSFSLFTHNSYTFFEKFTITLGARIESQRIGIGHSRDARGVILDNPYGDIRLLSPHYVRNNSYRYNVSRFIFDYKPIESLMIFVGISRGYKNAGYSTAVNQASLAAFKPEINDTIELGIKSKHFKDSLGINLTYFYTEATDFHVIRAISIAEAVNLNAEKVTIRGAEIESYMKPWKYLRLGFSAGYTEGMFNKFYDRVLDTNFDGKHVHFIPQYDFVSYMQYRSPSGLFFRCEFQAVGKMYFAADNTIYSSPYSVANLKIGYEEERLSAYLYCNNLNNEYYFTSYIDGTFRAVPGAPRTYGFIVNYKI